MRKTFTVAALLTALALQPAAAESWHTYHGDFALKGVSAEKFPDKPTRLWRTKVGDLLPSAVVGGDGRLFCIADDTTITALDMKGAILWSRTIEGRDKSPKKRIIDEKFDAPPLYVNESLLVVASTSGNVYGIAPSDGKTKWKYEAGAKIRGSANYEAGTKGAPGRIFIVTKEKGFVHAISAADGKGLWKSEKLDRTDGHLAVDGARVVLGNCTASFIALRTSDGFTESIVNVGKECEMADGVATAGGLAFSGNRNGSFAAADLENESIVWLFEENKGYVFTTPALSSTRAVFLGSSAILFCLDRKTGEKQWELELGGNIPLSPVIADNIVIAGIDGRIYGVNIKSGEEEWSLTVGDDISQPAIVDGVLVAGSDDGYIAAYGKDGTK